MPPFEPDPTRLAARFAALACSPGDRAAKTRRIYRAVLDASTYLRAGNFESIAVADLRRLFQLYDSEFFGGWLGDLVRSSGVNEVRFRLSPRMTQAAGKTIHRKVRTRVGLVVVERPDYEIVISTALLFENFSDATRAVTVAGLPCGDRLEALQRVFEHELIHLAEFLILGRSSCSAEPFQKVAQALFGHSASHHELVTRRELAATTWSIRPGDRVAFDHEGKTLAGVVNRITKRATILVEDPAGRLYSNGRRYVTFYVPLEQLRKDDPL